MKYILLFIFVFFINSAILSQIVYVSVNNNVYKFLDELYVKGFIDINDVIKPFPRNYIAQKINEASAKTSEMTNIEREEYEYYKKEYYSELKILNKEKVYPQINYLNRGESGRFRFFSYKDSLFAFSADPISGYDINYRDTEIIIHGINGVDIFGNITRTIGFHLTFYDNTERGKIIDYNRKFSDLSGFSFRYLRKDGIDYDNVNAALTYGWNWGEFSIIKDYLKWGSGRFGQLILSDKAPSFPMIKLSINPVDWLSFEYIHGYLNSNVIDSSTMRHNVGDYREHYENVSKYIAAHMLSITPLKYLNISLGESIIYSDKFEPIYLIPLIFFRIADHNNAANQSTSGNVQLFSDVSVRLPIIRSIFYSSLFIDELSIADNDPSAIGYTFGFQMFDPLIKDCNFNIEYTKIDPFVYFHVDDAQGFSNYDYQLGHWIGSNGDQICFSFEKNLMRGLKISTYYEYIRKGQKELKTEPRYQAWQKFLYGLRTNYSYFGIDITYEIIHSLVAKMNFKYSSIDHEQQDHSFINERYNDFSAGLSYGL